MTVSAMPSRSDAAAPGVAVIDVCGEPFQALGGLLMIVVLPRRPEPAADLIAVAIGEVIEDVALLVRHAALDRDFVAEYLADRLAQRFGAVDHE